MANFKSLMIAAAATLSLGAGTAMAQEGDSSFWQNDQPVPAFNAPAHRQALPLTAQPQAGSSDAERTQAHPQQILIGGDGATD